MAIHSVTRSRVGDGTISIAVHDTEIRVAISEAGESCVIAQGGSSDIRRTAYALLSAAEELDQRIKTARAGAAEDDLPR